MKSGCSPTLLIVATDGFEEWELFGPRQILQKLDAECPYQVVLPRRQLTDDSEILNFLLRYAGKFDMYVEDDYAAFVRYCFEDPLDAEIFRSRFEPKAERFRLAG